MSLYPRPLNEREVLARKPGLPKCCCMETPDPGPWQAGVDDAADPAMINRMHEIVGRLRYDISNEELITLVRYSVGLDQRTRLGYHIQCCVLHNAASRLALLTAGENPYPSIPWFERLRAAWDVWKGRATTIQVKQ